MPLKQAILILTMRHDVHATAVAWGLRSWGCDVNVWVWSDFLQNEPCSIYENNASEGSDVTGKISATTKIDTVWYRRRSPVEVRPGTHTADIDFVEREARAYLNNIVFAIGNDKTRWINGFYDAAFAENKLIQLKAAKSVGMRIPNTLMSNDPGKIRQFYAENESGIIYKGFKPAFWIAPDGASTNLRTSLVSEADIGNDEQLLTCPGIYQEKIDKAYELRINVIGDEVRAVAIYSQVETATMDWRYDLRDGEIPLREITIPDVEKIRCIELCKKFNLRFCAVDMIVTPSGEYVFLEMNQAGQFLWIEQIDPAIDLLDTFCRFVMGGSAVRCAKIRYSDFLKSDDYQSWLKEFSDNPPGIWPIGFRE